MTDSSILRNYPVLTFLPYALPLLLILLRPKLFGKNTFLALAALFWLSRSYSNPPRGISNGNTAAYGSLLPPRLPAMSSWLLHAVGLVYFAVLARLYWLIGDRRRNEGVKRWEGERCSMGVFMGSGGHTSEMRTLLSSLDFERYSPRTYIYCHGDDMSLRVIKQLELEKAGETDNRGTTSPAEIPGSPSPTLTYTTLPLPRARRVGQPRLSSAFSVLRTLLVAFWYTFCIPLCRNPRKPWVDVLVLNGPGTAVVLVAITWIRRFFALPYTQVIYVESFARTNSLSLSGRLLRHTVDVFVVQWPEAAGVGSSIPLNDRARVVAEQRAEAAAMSTGVQDVEGRIGLGEGHEQVEAEVEVDRGRKVVYRGVLV